MMVADHVDLHRPTWLRRHNLVRFELGCMSAFHAIVGLIILFAPRGQVVTPRTAAIFGTIPPNVWVLFFLLTALTAGAAVAQQSPLWLWATWCQVFPIGAGWVLGFSLSIPEGQGSAIYPVTWAFLLIWWVLTAIRVRNGEQGARWNGGS